MLGESRYVSPQEYEDVEAHKAAEEFSSYRK